MNLRETLARISGRRSCISDKTTKFYKTSRIINNSNTESIRIGPFSHVRGELLTFGHGGKIQIGDYCYIGEYTRIWSAISISIGDRVLVSHNVNIFDNITHPINPKLRHEHFKAIITSGHPRNIDLKESPVVIENDVLIGCMSIILRGVTIGECSIIGAGSVVTEDVPAYSIAEGNPARIVREISNDER